MKMRGVAIAVLALNLTMGYGQTIPEIDRNDLTELTGRVNDTTYVINFWATWCSPCVKEIGYFQELYQEYETQKLKVILVSLDFPNQKERRVIPFIREKGITAPVKLVTDLDYNAWINLVDPSWSGALPATLIYNANERVFLEKELSRNELYEQVNQILN